MNKALFSLTFTDHLIIIIYFVFVSENERTVAAVRLLKEKNIAGFGKLMTESHNSLKENYEVSSLFLNELVRLALLGEECIGSRMTGAGFGGCTVSIVRNDAMNSFKRRVTKGYLRYSENR